jgi:hypothetical protein
MRIHYLCAGDQDAVVPPHARDRLALRGLLIPLLARTTVSSDFP